MSSSDDTSTTAGFGHGMLLLALANAAYVVTAYATTTITARLLEPADFGAFGVVMAWVTILTTLLVKGVSTSTAREMSSGRVDEATAWRAGRGVGLRLAIALGLLGVAASPLVAPLLGSREHVTQFALGALGALTFGTNAVLLAWPTGRRLYPRQALAQVAYAVARVVLVVGGAATFGLVGAVVGYVLAPLVASAPLVARRPAASEPLGPVRRRMWRDVVPVAAASLAVTAYFVVDVFALSSVVGGADRQVGIYVAYGTVAHVPFFLLQAASVALVPALAATRSAVERSEAIRRTLTDTVVLLAGPTLLLATAGDAAARVVFGSEYDTPHLVVLPLALATGAVTLLANLVAVEVAVGRLRECLAVTLTGAVVLGLACHQVAASSDLPAASAVAWAALASTTAVTLALAILVRIRHGALVESTRAAAGLLLAAVASAGPLAFGSDVARTVIAAGAGLAWLALLLRLQLLDVGRARPRGASALERPDVEHAEAAPGPVDVP